MTGYITHKNVTIRFRSGLFDVHVGDHAPYKQFTSFEDLEQAKAFIDAGRVVTNQVVYWTETQTPVAA
jgi:hypothetical protein